MHTGQLSDEALAARVAQGHLTAFETLYDRHASMVLGMALRIIGDRAVAEEILQETFWRMWQSAGTYQPKHGPFTNWLFKIARSLAIEIYRKRCAHPKAIMDGTADKDPIAARIPDPDIDVPNKSQQMRSALKTLPHEQRRVVEMAYFQGMTRQEIAKATSEPIGTIHTRARLGLQKLREALKRTGFEF